MEIAMIWFQNNSLAANPKKFQLMFLGTQKIVNKCVNINGNIFRSKTSIKLLGVCIDWKLNFNTHVKALCSKANSKIRALYRLRSYLDSTQKLMLYNSFIMSSFYYCPVIWMFCGKTTNDKVNSVQKRALQALYNDFNSSYQDLLDKGSHLTIHEINKKYLLIEVYKCINKENPPFLNGIFKSKERHIGLRIKNLLSLPKTFTKTWGLHSLAYRGSRSWNTLSDDIKGQSTLTKFKAHLKRSNKLPCPCKLCFRE